MAGHSKWANIQHRKGKQDKLRSKMFSKLAKEITVAAKMGDPDPDKNPRLRLAVKAAKAVSMPKDVIERAIKKSQGGDAEDYSEIRYEGYGPNGIAIIVETMTDNVNRTASNVRSYFTKYGGNLGTTGSVSFMFDRVGEITYKPAAGDADTVMMAAIEPAPTMSSRTKRATGSIAATPASTKCPKRSRRCWARARKPSSSGSRRTAPTSISRRRRS